MLIFADSPKPSPLNSSPPCPTPPRLLDRKANLTLSFSHMSGFEDLYNRLRIVDNPVVSHMANAFTKTTALFSCVEVKPASGDHTEVEYQLSIRMAASLRKKMRWQAVASGVGENKKEV
ncbi:hypothetical protein BU26DRAFT_610958 [Trematosphaeria pertusa]|uniref:Uncharacterized protein n=1 Tax=Trematosphaeria pertusa TaxID=390896 RepID=A0A6A6HTI9_9PLEO|nr:uncharacterized protein BU26DRAFT_610958 [Trematosphaeria pertusa]KAF2241485.1 hypothetical protein BU26DRAFT_610958 [Trematosphaeria pertusa]